MNAPVSSPTPPSPPAPATKSAGTEPTPYWFWPAMSLLAALVLGSIPLLILAVHAPPEKPSIAPTATDGAHAPLGSQSNPIPLRVTDENGRSAAAGPAMPVPDFSFTERSGRTVTRQNLLGRVWVADFIFTHCTGTCPVMTSSLKTVQARCQDLPNLRLVSFTVDPERDTPARLTDYAESQGADRERWLFLTGEQKALYTFAREAFKLAVGENKSDPQTAIGESFIHSSRLVLVDSQGRVVALYSGTDKGSVEALIAELHTRTDTQGPAQ